MNVAIVGAGNVAWSLIPALQAVGWNVVQLISRNEVAQNRFQQAYGIPLVGSLADGVAPNVDYVFLTVPDGVIGEVAHDLAKVASPHSIIVHTSGSISLSTLSDWGERAGVWYPMQTFSQHATRDFSGIPIFVEGTDLTLEPLKQLAEALSDRTYLLNSEARARLHMGAVMVCNFTNLLYRLAEEQVPGVDIQAYEPLIRGHIENVFQLGPAAAQTGPALRGDDVVLQRHLDMLAQTADAQALYTLMSEMIQQRK